jgi:vancomycin resistance protein YoaR
MSEELPHEFERRGENRAASQWVRTALTEQANKMDTLTEKVDALHDTMTKATPDGNIKKHHDVHVMLNKREELANERKKFWRTFRDDIMKKGLTAIVVFIAALFALGSQAKFKEWVQAASITTPTPAPAITEVKK